MSDKPPSSYDFVPLPDRALLKFIRWIGNAATEGEGILTILVRTKSWTYLKLL